MIEKILRKYTLRWSPTMFKATLVTTLLLALFVPVVIVGLPWIEFLNDMAAQPKAKTQMTYGRVWGEQLPTDRLPPEGTVARNQGEAYPFKSFGNAGEDIPAEDKFKAELSQAKSVGQMWVNPLEPSMEVMKKGQNNFNIYCKTCHGKRGHGDGPATGPDRFPRPPSLHTDEVREYKDGTIYHIITNGVGKMHGYPDKLDQTERWEVIHYLRALQRSQNPNEEDIER